MRTTTRARAGLAAALGAAALIAPVALPAASAWERWHPASPLVLGWFQPSWLLAAALWQLGLGAVLTRSPAPLGAPQRLVAAGAATMLVAILSLLATPLGTLAGDAWAWLATTERFQAIVAESQPQPPPQMSPQPPQLPPSLG